VISEAEFKTRVCARLRQAGCYVVRTVTGGMGAAGTPDLLICARGLFVGAEVKRDARGRATPWQLRRLDEIRAAGGRALVVHPGNVETLYGMVEDASRSTEG
jgi:Holliday junction resolvase